MRLTSRPTRQTPPYDLPFAVACLGVMLPILLSIYPPMVDIPQHAAQIMALKALALGEPWPFASFFEFQALTPYWLGYGLVLLLSGLVDIVLAMKLVIGLAQVAFVWCAARYCAHRGVPKEWRWLLLLLPFGFAFHWGFLNFIVAAPLGLFVADRILRLEPDEMSVRKTLRIALLLHLLFFAHILITAFICAVVALSLTANWRGLKVWLCRCAPLFSVLPITAFWFLHGVNSSPYIADRILWNHGIDRFIDLVPALAAAPRGWQGWATGALLLLLPFAVGFRPSRAPARLLPFLLYLLLMLFGPNYVGGNYFTYQRFDLFGLPLYLCCFERRNGSAPTWPLRASEVVAGLLAALFLAWQLHATRAFNAEARGARAVLEQAAPGKRMLMLAFNPGSATSYAPLFLHMASWYQAQTGGLAEFNFARFWAMPLKFKSDAPSSIGSGFEWYPTRLNCELHRLDRYEFLLARTDADVLSWLAPRCSVKFRLVAQSGSWQLLERMDGSRAPAGETPGPR